MDLKIKKAHHLTVVGFNNSGLPLGHRTDLLELGIIARESNDHGLIDMFEELPPIADLRRMKEGNVLPKLPPKKK